MVVRPVPEKPLISILELADHAPSHVTGPPPYYIHTSFGFTGIPYIPKSKTAVYYSSIARFDSILSSILCNYSK